MRFLTTVATTKIKRQSQNPSTVSTEAKLYSFFENVPTWFKSVVLLRNVISRFILSHYLSLFLSFFGPRPFPIFLLPLPNSLLLFSGVKGQKTTKLKHYHEKFTMHTLIIWTKWICCASVCVKLKIIVMTIWCRGFFRPPVVLDSVGRRNYLHPILSNLHQIVILLVLIQCTLYIVIFHPNLTL